jgi:hypothetical protein
MIRQVYVSNSLEQRVAAWQPFLAIRVLYERQGTRRSLARTVAERGEASIL